MVSCTLNEVFYGCYKTVEYQREVLLEDGTNLMKEKVTREIQIKPGMGCHTIIRYSGEGNQRKGQF
jgi:DnaJ family protein B protein 13